MEPIKAIQSAVISEATAASNEIVAAVANRKIRVLAYTLISAGAVNVTWKSGATAKSGPMPLAANTGASPSTDPPGLLFETGVGEALNLELSAAVQVSGHVSYQLVPDTSSPIAAV